MQSLQLKKLPICNRENASTLMFLQYLSQICLSFSLVVFEKPPVYRNLKYTFFLLLIVLSVLFSSALNFQKLFNLVIYNKNRAIFSIKYFLISLIS